MDSQTGACSGVYPPARGFAISAIQSPRAALTPFSIARSVASRPTLLWDAVRIPIYSQPGAAIHAFLSSTRDYDMAINTMTWLTEQDYNRLRGLLVELTRQSRGMQAGLETLEEILDLARLVQPEMVPNTVVTMNSKVLFEDVQTQEMGTVTIVYPQDADPSNNKVSVLSPVGAALIGESEGKEIGLPLPRDLTRRIRIINVLYQPEAHGNFEL
jgi:regulator of nucleoside diphosphate kinase